jgi:hypothetical protein
MHAARNVLSIVMATSLLLNCARAAAPAAGDVKRATDKCANWLIEKYDVGDKSYGKGKEGKDLMTSALIVSGLCNHPRDYKESNGPFVTEPVKFLLSKIKKDGSVKDVKDCECECTSLIISALESTHNEAHQHAIASLKSYLDANFKDCVQKAEKDAAWTKQDQLSSIALEHDPLLSALHNAKAALKQGKKEIDVEGKPTAWAPALAEAILKHQKPNGSFGDDIQTNALALNILDVCYKGLKLQ